MKTAGDGSRSTLTDLVNNKDEKSRTEKVLFFLGGKLVLLENYIIKITESIEKPARKNKETAPRIFFSFIERIA